MNNPERSFKWLGFFRSGKKITNSFRLDENTTFMDDGVPRNRERKDFILSTCPTNNLITLRVGRSIRSYLETDDRYFPANPVDGISLTREELRQVRQAIGELLEIPM